MDAFRRFSTGFGVFQKTHQQNRQCSSTICAIFVSNPLSLPADGLWMCSYVLLFFYIEETVRPKLETGTPSDKVLPSQVILIDGLWMSSCDRLFYMKVAVGYDICSLKVQICSREMHCWFFPERNFRASFDFRREHLGHFHNGGGLKDLGTGNGSQMQIITWGHLRFVLAGSLALKEHLAC